jgi:hypothetical protein
MGLKDIVRRLTASVEELDAERLQERFAGLDRTTIAQMPLRQPVRIGGEIIRMRIVPRSGTPSLEIVVSDGTGEVVAVFAGRRSLGGVDHGRGIVLEGVAHTERGRTVVLNPAYTLLAV